MMYKCIKCSNSFSRNTSDINRGRTKFCSMECSKAYKREKANETANKIIRLGKKQCKICNRTRKLQYFPKSKLAICGYYSYCYDCKRNINRQQDLKRYDKRKANSRQAYIWRTYGITIKEYEDMLNKQNGLCAICLQQTTTKPHAIDHNHNTGKIRGLLCQNCNRGLGMFKDNIESLQRAIEYLK